MAQLAEGNEVGSLPLKRNVSRRYILDTSVVIYLLQGDLVPEVEAWLQRQALARTVFVTKTAYEELSHRGFTDLGRIEVCHLTVDELTMARTLTSNVRGLDGGGGVFKLQDLQQNDLNIYMQACVFAARPADRRPAVFITNDLKFAKRWIFSLQRISEYLHWQASMVHIPCVSLSMLVPQGSSPLSAARVSFVDAVGTSTSPSATWVSGPSSRAETRGRRSEGREQSHGLVWRPVTRSVYQQMEWNHALREDTRKDRKRETSTELGSDVLYVFDDAAMKKSNEETKSWIDTTISSGYGIIVDRPYLRVADCRKCESILDDVRKVIPDLMDDALTPSICAYILAGDVDSTYRVGAFVTGNDKMLKLIVDEGSREELHDAVTARGFAGVPYYMFMDNGGQLQRADLKWDDPARPSDQRMLQHYRISSVEYKEILKRNNHVLD